jgi:predicted RecA/RadA family phage recombinase
MASRRGNQNRPHFLSQGARLQMKNFVQPGDAVDVVAPTGGLVSGQAVLIGNLFGVAAYSLAAGASAEIVIRGVFTLPKAVSIASAQGDRAYWDATALDITPTVGSNKWVGVVTDAVSGSATTVNVRLNGFPS